MRIRQMKAKGLSISEISRQVRRDRKTVQKAIRRGFAPPPKRQRGGVKKFLKLEPYMDDLQKRMAEGVFNAAVLLDELRAVGYSGGVTVIKQYIRPYRPKRTPVATIRFETPPGEQAQVDFVDIAYCIPGKPRVWLRLFNYVLSYSRLSYMEFMFREDRVRFLRGLDHAFRATGGVPKTVLSDNLKAAVIAREEDGEAVFAPQYLSFAQHYGFIPAACRPGRAQTKGKVERVGRYVQENFLPRVSHRMTELDLTVLNHHLWHWLDQTANLRIHGTTHERPMDLFNLEEAAALNPLPAFPAGLDETAMRRVSRDGFVQWKTNRYSVPWIYAGRELILHETPEQALWVESDGQEITRFPLNCERHRVFEVPAHRSGLKEAVLGRGKIAQAPAVDQWPLEQYDRLAGEGA